MAIATRRKISAFDFQLSTLPHDSRTGGWTMAVHVKKYLNFYFVDYKRLEKDTPCLKPRAGPTGLQPS
jgi:hypothetical protein